MQQLTRSMGLIKKCGPSNHGVALGPGQMEFEIAAESAWRFGIWDTFCNFLLESFNSMQFRTVNGLGKDMAALMKTLEQKPKSFFPIGYALGSYHLKWLCRSLALVLAV